MRSVLVGVGVLCLAGCGPSSRPRSDAPLIAEPPTPVQTAAPAAAPEPAPESSIVARNFVVGPGKFAEVNLDLGAGVGIVAVFRADGDVEWNVHSHPEDGVAIHREATGAAGTIEFTAPAPGAYSVLWKNTGSADINLIVSLEFPSGARIQSWVPDEN